MDRYCCWVVCNSSKKNPEFPLMSVVMNIHTHTHIQYKFSSSHSLVMGFSRPQSYRCPSFFHPLLIWGAAELISLSASRSNCYSWPGSWISARLRCQECGRQCCWQHMAALFLTARLFVRGVFSPLISLLFRSVSAAWSEDFCPRGFTQSHFQTEWVRKAPLAHSDKNRLKFTARMETVGWNDKWLLRGRVNSSETAHSFYRCP